MGVRGDYLTARTSERAWLLSPERGLVLNAPLAAEHPDPRDGQLPWYCSATDEEPWRLILDTGRLRVEARSSCS